MVFFGPKSDSILPLQVPEKNMKNGSIWSSNPNFLGFEKQRLGIKQKRPKRKREKAQELARRRVLVILQVHGRTLTAKQGTSSVPAPMKQW
jgi:hypothetical protein